MALQDTTSEATLELTLLSTDLLNKPQPSSSSNFLSRSSSSSSQFAVAWIDPSIKKSTKTLNTILHFPLPPPSLRNPTSALTIHILSSRLPFRRPKLLGAASLPLSSLRLSGELLTLQLRKPPSGRGRGTIRIAARILWCLGDITSPPDFPCIVDPTAPPPPMDFLGEDCQSFSDSTAPMMPDLLTVDMEAPIVEDESGDCDCQSVDFREVRTVEESRGCDGIYVEQILPGNVEDKPDGKRVWKSFLVGLASGTVAAVLVGAAGLSEG